MGQADSPKDNLSGSSQQASVSQQASGKKYRRWYEREPMVKQSIELLETFPDEILTIVAEGVNKVAEQEFRAAELMKTYKSLGQEKIISLYKSKNKLRSYDKNAMMHKAVNYFLLISEENRLVMSTKVIELVGVVRDYLHVCKEASEPPVALHVTTIRDSYVEAGLKGARQKLLQIRELFLGERFASRIKQPAAPPKAVVANPESQSNRMTNLDDDDSGMKLNLSRRR
ncbi:MAG: hypothetical protein VKJ04_01900 [Vampirovibrionales bacterium]|nr:hypothetical protein [Vampirovibrionales bacterium]